MTSAPFCFDSKIYHLGLGRRVLWNLNPRPCCVLLCKGVFQVDLYYCLYESSLQYTPESIIYFFFWVD